LVIFYLLGIGKVEVKQSVMLEEGHMDDGLTLTRAQDEESRSALVIRKCTSLFNKFIKGKFSVLRQKQVGFYES